MSRPITTFDQPQFTLRLDTDWRKYANVDNMAQITDGDVNIASVFVIIPTELFTLMRDALRIKRGLQVSVYFLVSGPSHVIFGVTDGIVEWDLWSYVASNLPPFLAPHVTLEPAS